jgi:uncharacterized membrane protein
MNERDVSIDILRGIAIFTMIAANMAAHSLVEPHSFAFRVYGSLAAPMFVFLAGMMVSYTATIKAHRFPYYLKRALATLLVASLIDIFLWDILPFVTYDVLYMIALAMPVIFFFNKLPRIPQVALILFIFGMTPVLQYFLGYTSYPAEVIISDGNIIPQVKGIPVWRHFLFEGWFPLFPWLGVSLLGAFVGSFKFKTPAEIFNKNLLIAGGILFLAGMVMWIIVAPEVHTSAGFIGSPKSPTLFRFLITRGGYSELFYPPTLLYLFSFLGFILLLIPLMYKLQKSPLLKWLTVYGRSSLLVYISHTVFIAFVFNRMDAFEFWPFMGLYLIHALVLWLICFGVQQFKKGKQFPFIVNFILGG